MADPIEILKMARLKIDAPASWGKGRRHFDRPINTCCVAEAVEESAGTDYENRRRALHAVYNAAGLDREFEKITEWNDEPQRTHDEVLKTLDLAIATLKI